MENVLTGLISAGATIYGIYKMNSARENKQDYELQQIKKRLETHNHYAERIGNIEKDIAVIKDRIMIRKD